MIVLISNGKIKIITLPEFYLLHTYITKEGTSGIIKLRKYQVIGINKGYSLIYNSNGGALITKPIEEFIHKYFYNYNHNQKISDEKITDILINNNLGEINLCKEEEKNHNNLNEQKNEITIIYKNYRNENMIRIFGDKFVDNNKAKEKRSQYKIILKGIEKI